MGESYENRDEWSVYDPASLARAIVHFRKEAGLTQEQLATESGLHRPYLSQLERGRVSAQTERLLRVLRRLGLEITVRPQRFGPQRSE